MSIRVPDKQIIVLYIYKRPCWCTLQNALMIIGPNFPDENFRSFSSQVIRIKYVTDRILRSLWIICSEIILFNFSFVSLHTEYFLYSYMFIVQKENWKILKLKTSGVPLNSFSHLIYNYINHKELDVVVKLLLTVALTVSKYAI